VTSIAGLLAVIRAKVKQSLFRSDVPGTEMSPSYVSGPGPSGCQ